MRPAKADQPTNRMRKHWVTTHMAPSKASDQTARMCRHILLFSERTCYFVGFVELHPKYANIVSPHYLPLVLFFPRNFGSTEDQTIKNVKYNCLCACDAYVLHCVSKMLYFEITFKTIRLQYLTRLYRNM